VTTWSKRHSQQLVYAPQNTGMTASVPELCLITYIYVILCVPNMKLSCIFFHVWAVQWLSISLRTKNFKLPSTNCLDS